MTEKNVKKRYWAFVLYPESAPEHWIEFLQLTGLPCAISPLHDRDVNPTGEVKKAHHHVILCYAGPTTFNSVKGLTDALNQPIPQPLEQIRGYYRYLTHKDNPEKAQYSESDIKIMNGFNIADFSELTRSEVQEEIRRLMDFIRAVDLVEYSDFLENLQDNADWVGLEIASTHTLLFNSYLKSRRHRTQKNAADAPRL